MTPLEKCVADVLGNWARNGQKRQLKPEKIEPTKLRSAKIRPEGSERYETTIGKGPGSERYETAIGKGPVETIRENCLPLNASTLAPNKVGEYLKEVESQGTKSTRMIVEREKDFMK